MLAVERFDGKAWRDETQLPGQGINAPAAVELNGRIYLIGGFGTTTNIPLSDVLVYEPKSRQWTTAAPLPAPRGGHSAVVMDGKIHVIGGGNSQTTLAAHSVYDPAYDRWTERAPLPRSEGSPAAVVLSGKLYVIGGRSGLDDFGEVFIYDPAFDSWSLGPPIQPKATCGAVAINETIYLCGGESQHARAVLADVQYLQPGATQWQPAPPLPTARSFARAAVFKRAIYVVGGSLKPQRNHAPQGTEVVECLNL